MVCWYCAINRRINNFIRLHAELIVSFTSPCWPRWCDLPLCIMGKFDRWRHTSQLPTPYSYSIIVSSCDLSVLEMLILDSCRRQERTQKTLFLHRFFFAVVNVSVLFDDYYFLINFFLNPDKQKVSAEYSVSSHLHKKEKKIRNKQIRGKKNRWMDRKRERESVRKR